MISTENLFYVRFILLLVKAGKYVLTQIVNDGLKRKKFVLTEFLRINKDKIQKSSRINDVQIQILYPTSGIASDTSKWDITLLAHFACNYFTEPNSQDRKAVEKIRDLRNEYFHRADALMDANEFEELVTIITTMGHKYSQDKLAEINALIESIRKMELQPALEDMKTLDQMLTESIEGRLGMIEGRLINIESTVQQTSQDIKSYHQEVLQLKESIRKGAERNGEAILSFTNVDGQFNVYLSPENQAALAEMINGIISSSRNVLEQAKGSSILEKQVSNVIQDIRGIGGEVEDVQRGSVVYTIRCSSLTHLMYVIDYFYSPRIKIRLNEIAKALGENVELTADILPESLRNIQTLKEDDNIKIKEERPTAKTSTSIRAKAFLDNREKDKAQVDSQTGQIQSTYQGQQAETSTNQKKKKSKTESQELLISIDDSAKRCRDIITDMKNMFNSKQEKIRQYPCVKTWLLYLENIEKKLDFKPIKIAVLGSTGEGKSSLMNAILDHRDALPTSGTESCTATVVEVVESKTKLYQAEIEFLEEKEWLSELRNLCEDLTDGSGFDPECSSSDDESYCKIVALYGKLDSYDNLLKETSKTKWLGKTKSIEKESLDDFIDEVTTYIVAQESETDQAFWPIVKRVRLKFPDCDVCSSGAILVDLPGREDSNAARNKIATSHIGDCDAIWIVSSIHRAINDRTAECLLGEHFRSQLYMDGQFDAVSFICTKTDMINVKESRREMKDLKSHTDELVQQITQLDSQKNAVSKDKSNIDKEIQTLNQLLKREEDAKKQLADKLQELGSFFDKESCEEVDKETSERLSKAEEEIQKELSTAVENIRAKETELEGVKMKLEKVLSERRDLELQIEEKTKALTEICVKFRNEKCQFRIKKDFSSGIKAVKMASSVKSADKKDTKELQIQKLDENLKVFCCSSTDYELIKHREPGDTGPMVFSDEDDTQIPMLQNQVHVLTSTRKKATLLGILSELDVFVSEVQSHLTVEKDMKLSEQNFTKSEIESELQTHETSMQTVLNKLSADLNEIFDRKVIVKLKEGASVAAREADAICGKWGEKRYMDKGKLGGLHHRTYQATVRRNGVHLGVNFNKDLAQPMLNVIAVEWNNVFSDADGSVLTTLNEFKDGLLGSRKQFLENLLVNFGIRKETSEKFRESLHNSASSKMTSIVEELRGKITREQRNISRVITPIIQECLVDVYGECARITGKGMFEKMKLKMTEGIGENCTMFEQAADKMAYKLHLLKDDIIKKLTEESTDLIYYLKIALELLWKDNKILRISFGADVKKFSLDVQKVLEDFKRLEEGPSQKKQKLQSKSA